jgi:hypothetical protein
LNTIQYFRIADFIYQEDTLWLRTSGRGETQQQAFSEALSFNQTDPRRLSILKLLATWKINLELSGELEQVKGTLEALYLGKYDRPKPYFPQFNLQSTNAIAFASV